MPNPTKTEAHGGCVDCGGTPNGPYKIELPHSQLWVSCPNPIHNERGDAPVPMQQDARTGRWVPAVPIPYDPRDDRNAVSWAIMRLLRWLHILPPDPWAEEQHNRE